MYITIAAIVVIGYVVWKLLGDEEHPLDKLPGPPRKPIIGNVLQFLRIRPRELFVKMRENAKEFNGRYVVKIIKRRILHIHGVKDVEIVLSHSKNIKKSMPYSFLEPWLGTGLLLSSGSKWHKRRKILTPTFHFNILKSFVIVMEERSRALVERLKTVEGAAVDLLPLMSDYTLFTICETAMGTQLHSDKSAATLQYKKAIMEISSLLLTRLTRVWLHNDFLFKNFPIGQQFAKCLKIVHSFADNVIMERKKNWISGEQDFMKVEDTGRKRRLAMLDLLLEAENKGEINLEGIREEVNTFMFEGHDTTAMALVFGSMLLADHEEVQDQIYEECRHILGDSDRAPTMAHMAEMKYLEAVIKEILRLYPSVPFIAREIAEDFMLDDLLVPRGSEVAVHIYDLHHQPDLYPDPEVFRPERFLNNEVTHPYAFVPFSAGPRNCIGQRFAMLELKSALSAICRNFRLKPLIKGARPVLLADLLIRPADPVFVKFVSR